MSGKHTPVPWFYDSHNTIFAKIDTEDVSLEKDMNGKALVQICSIPDHPQDGEYSPEQSTERSWWYKQSQENAFLIEEMSEVLAETGLTPRQLAKRVKTLQAVCAEAYQLAGAAGASIEALDNLSDAANGDVLRHETFLPVTFELEAQRKELLEALDDALAVLESRAARFDSEMSIGEIRYRVIEKARAVIARAKEPRKDEDKQG